MITPELNAAQANKATIDLEAEADFRPNFIFNYFSRVCGRRERGGGWNVCQTSGRARLDREKMEEGRKEVNI